MIPGCILYARLKCKNETKQIKLELTNNQLQQALEEVKTLRGTLPICAKCKSIRNDEGYWDSIEQYLMAHTDTDFSHGVCPECMEQMYAGQNWYENYKKKQAAKAGSPAEKHS